MKPFLIPTTEEGIYELEFDNTTKELFETCNRAGQYYKVLGRELDSERSALFAGGALHTALATRMEAQFYADRPTWRAKAESDIIEAYMMNPLSPEEWRTPELLIDTMEAYARTYPLEAEPFHLLETPEHKPAVELPFHLLLGVAEINQEVELNGAKVFIKSINCYFTGRIDAIVNYDVPMVLDHKTTSMEGQSFYDDFIISGQMLGYTWASRQLGYPVQGLVLDAIAWRKPTKSGKGTTFLRQRYFYTDEQVAEWKRDTFSHITDFLEHLCHGYFPKSPKWCFGKYGRCQYFSVCCESEAKRLPMLNGPMFKDVTWSPLNP